MQLFISLTFAAFLFFVVSLFVAPSAQAATVVLSGIARDSESNLLSNTKVVVADTITHEIVGTTVTGISGYYLLSVPEGKYDITIIPPKESGVPETKQTNVSLSIDTTYDISAKPSLRNTIQSTSFIILLGILGLLLVILLLGYLLSRKKR